MSKFATRKFRKMQICQKVRKISGESLRLVIFRDTRLNILLQMKYEEKKISSYLEKIFTKVKKEEIYIFFLSCLSFSFIEVTLIKCPRTLTGPSLRTLLARATLSKTTWP